MNLNPPKPFNIVSPEKYLENLMSKLTKEPCDVPGLICEWYRLNGERYLHYDYSTRQLIWNEKLTNPLTEKYKLNDEEKIPLIKSVAQRILNIKIS